MLSHLLLVLFLFFVSFSIVPLSYQYFFFFFNDTATTEIYTLSLHDALPICPHGPAHGRAPVRAERARGARRWPHPPDGEPVHGAPRRVPLAVPRGGGRQDQREDRKSTRLNSSHLVISYAVFCLKKKKIIVWT